MFNKILNNPSKYLLRTNDNTMEKVIIDLNGKVVLKLNNTQHFELTNALNVDYLTTLENGDNYYELTSDEE